jgi:hypothetical protein
MQEEVHDGLCRPNACALYNGSGADLQHTQHVVSIQGRSRLAASQMVIQHSLKTVTCPCILVVGYILYLHAIPLGNHRSSMHKSQPFHNGMAWLDFPQKYSIPPHGPTNSFVRPRTCPPHYSRGVACDMVLLAVSLYGDDSTFQDDRFVEVRQSEGLVGFWAKRQVLGNEYQEARQTVPPVSDRGYRYVYPHRQRELEMIVQVYSLPTMLSKNCFRICLPRQERWVGIGDGCTCMLEGGGGGVCV